MGRKEIEIAETEMPGLMKLEKNMGTLNLLKEQNCRLLAYDNTDCSANRNFS